MTDEQLDKLEQEINLYANDQLFVFKELRRRYMKYKAQNAVYRMQQQPTINVYYDNPQSQSSTKSEGADNE